MKKYLYLMAALMLGLTATVSLAACGDDDDDSEAKVAAYAEAEYSVVLSDDIVSYYDIDITFWARGKVGTVQDVKVWTASGRSESLPATFHYKYTFTKKAGKELPPTIRLSYKPNVTIKVFNKDGKQINSKKLTLQGRESSVEPAHVDLDEYFFNDIQFSYTVPKDGTLKDIEKK